MVVLPGLQKCIPSADQENLFTKNLGIGICFKLNKINVTSQFDYKLN